MKAGASEVCITPPVGVELAGYVAREQPSVGRHDDLYARGLYLEHGRERLLWVHCDLIGLTRDWVRELRAALAAEMQLAERQILLSATHTHSGPATLRLRECGRIDEGYVAALRDRLREAAVRAAAQPQPVTLRFAEGRCGLARDRRAPSPRAHVDERLAALAFLREDGSHLAVVANYAMHNVGLSHENRLISADVAGAAAGHVSDRLGRPCATLMTNGCCGNVNPPEHTTDPAVMEAYGRELGEAVLAAGEAAEPCAPALATAEETIDLPLTVLTGEQVLREHDRVCAGAAGGAPWQVRVRGAMRQWRDETLALLERGAPESVATDLQAIRIGPVCFAAIGAEVFSRMADGLRQRHGPRTYVVGYANGDLGYLPYREIYDEGGYEVDVAYKYYRNFMIAPGGYETVRDRAAALLRRLKA